MSTSDEDAPDIEREKQYWLDRLAGITADRKRLNIDERIIVKQARFAGISWEDIGAAIDHQDNITVQEKYGEPGPGETPF